MNAKLLHHLQEMTPASRRCKVCDRCSGKLVGTGAGGTHEAPLSHSPPNRALWPVSLAMRHLSCTSLIDCREARPATRSSTRLLHALDISMLC